MKVQIQQQAVRIRVDESELNRLVAGGCVENRTQLSGHVVWQQCVALHELAQPCLAASGQRLDIALPRQEVLALQARLPSRDGLQFLIPDAGASLTLQFDVDVRDSVRQRGAARRSRDATVSIA